MSLTARRVLLHEGMRTHKHAKRKTSDTLPRPSVVDLDPEDPTQNLDEIGGISIEPVAVEAQPDADGQAELDEAGVEASSELVREEDAPDQPPADVGDLYGVHTPRAADTDLAAREDQDAYQDATLGENWLEALEAKATEGGAVPELTIDVIDDSDDNHRGHHSTDTRDRPVADKGSGGPAGL